MNVFAEAAAIAAVGAGLTSMRERADETRRLRNRLLAALADAGVSALPSDANFVLIVGVDATAVAAKLAASGIRVRELQGLTGIGNAIRLTVGPWPVMERVVAILREATQ